MSFQLSHTANAAAEQLSAVIPRVTVVMPVFNGERFIAQAMRSVLGSTFRAFELLVIDDGSEDGSLRIAQDVAATDARVRVCSVAHGGVAAVRNFALAEARGELIANLDSDDIMFPDRLALQVAFLDKHPGHVAVGSRWIIVNEKDYPVSVGPGVFTHEEIDDAHMHGRGGSIGNPTAMFRKEAALRVGGYRGALAVTGEDFDLWLRLAEVGRVANLREVLVRYRVHGANISMGNREQREAVRLETLRRAFERRGITDRQPVLVPPPREGFAVRRRNAALVLYYRGNRRQALINALLASIDLSSLRENTRTIGTIVRTAPPRT